MADAEDKPEVEEELIPVDTPPPEDGGADNESSDDDEGEDERLATSQDDHDGDVESATRKKRVKRRNIQKQARDRTISELAAERAARVALEQRLAALEGNALNHNEMAIDQHIAQADAERKHAETIMARAIEEGNGADAIAAQSIRDAARDRHNELVAAKTRVSQAREQAGKPQADPAAATYAQRWVKDNPWYDPSGADENSAITNVLDLQLKREGRNPASEDYWMELTARVAARLAPKPNGAENGQRKAPPVGQSREHAPQSTRKEIYVTPERKQAMIEAGYWDDPVKRTQALKRYQAFDQASR